MVSSSELAHQLDFNKEGRLGGGGGGGDETRRHTVEVMSLTHSHRLGSGLLAGVVAWTKHILRIMFQTSERCSQSAKWIYLNDAPLLAWYVITQEKNMKHVLCSLPRYMKYCFICLAIESLFLVENH